MSAILQSFPEPIVDLCAALGTVYMVLCTIIVTVCIISGDIRISMIRDKEEKGSEQ